MTEKTSHNKTLGLLQKIACHQHTWLASLNTSTSTETITAEEKNSRSFLALFAAKRRAAKRALRTAIRLSRAANSAMARVRSPLQKTPLLSCTPSLSPYNIALGLEIRITWWPPFEWALDRNRAPWQERRKPNAEPAEKVGVQEECTAGLPRIV